VLVLKLGHGEHEEAASPLKKPAEHALQGALPVLNVPGVHAVQTSEAPVPALV
jgi:hypothetical protein